MKGEEGEGGGVFVAEQHSKRTNRPLVLILSSSGLVRCSLLSAALLLLSLALVVGLLFTAVQVTTIPAHARSGWCVGRLCDDVRFRDSLSGCYFANEKD